jgi:beta-lactamase regulating signal transducer with metallopeptidase domain/Tol biopolymer transport system component
MESLGLQLQPFFAWLLRSTLQASMLIGLILLVQITLRSKLGPRWSHALWVLLLLRMVLPWAPQSRASIFNLIPHSFPQIQTEYAPAQPANESFKSPVADKKATGVNSVSTSDASEGSSQPTAAVPQLGPAGAKQTKPAFLRAAKVLPLIWLAGALVLGIYICASNFSLLRIIRRERSLTDQKILDLLEDCKGEMGIRTILGVVATDKVKSACLFGFVRPRLLLPKGMVEALNREELRYVFLHELGHLKRHDIYLGWLMSILQVLHWFNPLVWLAFYRMRADRELACDALVLARTESSRAKDYGRTIVSLLERFSQARRLPALAGILETKAQLKRRITMIAQFKKNSYRWSPLAVVLIIILGCVSLPDARGMKASESSAAKPEAVSKTSPRLVVLPSTIEAQQSGPVVRELNIDIGWNTTFCLSRDGNKIVYWRWKNGKQNIVVRNLISGEDTEITNHVTGHTWSPVFSPDGSHVVYTWEDSAPYSLHTVSLQTGEVRCLNYNGFASDWSRDGRFILVFTALRFKEQTYSILSVEGDAAEKVDLSIPSESSGWRFSPDTKYVSYSHNGNLYLYRLEDKDVTQITEGSNEDSQPIWSPDGKKLLFLSRRGFGPELDLCGVPIVNGKAAGDVRVIRPDLGNDVELYSLSEIGRLLYGRNLQDRTIFSTAVDPQTGQPTSEPVKLAAGSHAIWSPDGKQIAYIAEGALHVMSPDGTNDQEITSVNFPDTGTYAWSADGDHIYIQELRKGGCETCAISISTKERRTVLPEDDKIHGPHLTCSPDGKRLAFIGQPRSSKKLQVFIADVDGTNVRQLTFDDTSNKYYPAWSPDGKEVAFEWASAGIWRLMTISINDGTIREVFRGETPQDRFYRKSWSPDGTKIAWESGDGILRIGQVSDGKYNTFKVSDRGVYACHWSPDGTKMLFCTWGDVRQLMIMDNFLPAEK